MHNKINLTCTFRMLQRTFNCNKCTEVHQRPIKCQQLVDNEHSDQNTSNTQDTNVLILKELKSLNGRMAVVEQK